MTDHVEEPKKVRRKDKPKVTALALLRRRLRNRERLTIEKSEAHVALDLWREEKRLGRKDDPVTSSSPWAGMGGVLPPGRESNRARLEGDPIRLQVARWVEGYPGSPEREAFEDWRRKGLDEAWMLRALRTRLPVTFLGPWEGVCEAELDEIDKEQEAMDEAERQEREHERQENRLMPGMRRDG